MTVAILWEGFVSDLFVAFISIDSISFKKFILSGISVRPNDDKSNQHKRAIGIAKINLPNSFSAPQIRSIVDSQDYNVTFSSVSEMCKHAGIWLSPTHKQGFRALSQKQKAFLAVVRTTRNFLAHRSQAAAKDMNVALQDNHLPTGIKRGINKIEDVGAFVIAGNPKRLLLFIGELKEIANLLCPEE